MPTTTSFDRRRFLTLCSALGLGSTLFPSALLAQAEEKGGLTRESVAQAAAIAGLRFDPEQEDMMLADLGDALGDYDAIRKLDLANSVAPALIFDPVLPGMKFESVRRPMRMSAAAPLAAPKNLEDAAFYSLRQLGELIRTRKVSSLALTQMYLERLKRYDSLLLFAVTLTEERALAQAREADRDLARGKYRGPLHGLPWGAKDLLAVKGYRTTWGAAGFEDQYIDEDATVVQRLDAAGAVLVAKLTLGALALGDKWFYGMTRNPWKTDQGSSGSSAGPASATVAGCVAFSIGSETLGSISSPSTRCGATGLRPTFGRVPRTGAMALSWSMDKLGPICRYVEDDALVLAAIAGADGHDRTAHDLPFNWDAALDLKTLRIGYLKADFDREPASDAKPEDKARRLESKTIDDAALDVLRSKLSLKLTPVELPKLPYGNMLTILVSESAAAFDQLTRSGRDKLLTSQTKDDWPNSFRSSRFIPAVEYIQANRARTLAMEQMAALFKKVDVIVTPTFSAQLLVTNLTGHPALILPNGFRADGTPTSLTFLGNLFGEAQICAVGRAYQQATEWHLRHPKLVPGPAPEPAKS
jgi:Asp-tRNA(Asn)/Glu-tRNA(Gln) amidotransferase A subunit family amidase